MGTGTLSKSGGWDALTAIGVIAALPREARSLTREPLPPGKCTRLTNGLLVTVAGVGAERALAAGEHLLANGARALVSWGAAGALDRSLAPGDLLLPQRVLGTDGEVFAVNRLWHTRLRRMLRPRLKVHTGLLAQSPCLVSSAREKQALRLRSRALAVDMESAAIGRLAREAGVPFLVIRAVTDTAGMDIPASVGRAVDDAGRVRLLRLLRGAMLHPADLAALLHLGRNFRAAHTTLAALAADTVPRLLPPRPDESA